jgi:hypothetical protein
MLLAVAAACADDYGDPAAWPAGLVLQVDGLQVWEHEVAPLVSYLASVDRRAGRRTRLAAILSAHLLPLKLAQRAFAAERAALRPRCEALRRAVDNGGFPELVAKGRVVPGASHLRLGRHELPLPLQSYAFAAENLGQTSPVLEVPQGFALIATEHLAPGTSRADDLADVFQVPFYSHSPDDFAAWLRGAQAAVAGRVEYVHPDYRDALPPWLDPPAPHH